MKIGQKQYKCGVCGQYIFDNIFVGVGFICPICETAFKRDDIGILITRDPSDGWKRRNADVWESIKRFNYPPKYMEIFTLK